MSTVAPYDFDEPVVWAGFVDGEACYAVADGTVHFPVAKNEPMQAHDGLLCATSALDGKSLLTGGEDGRVARVTQQGVELIAEETGKWIDTIAAGPRGACAFAAGRSVWIADEGSVKRIDHERAVEGLAFAPKGVRIAAARYNGVSLHWGAGGDVSELHWDGAHTGVSFSPDGKYIVTTMAENALHGWRLDQLKAGSKPEDGGHMRMSGYPAKPKSMSWSKKGTWLASSGAQAAICWPFAGKTGPQGKAPKELGTRGDALVMQVAFHPVEDVVAVGYNDGMVAAVRVEDAHEALLRRSGNGEITSLNWDEKGDRLAFGTANGEAGLIAI
ncbi:WD40 repeat domain-containing protein [Ahrensia sp. R2A130]|uniref:WD40 repeat domain-containing protein n=1 Tax=Ahrensia sp. R2A130 TaxID=744979 RepID=UPI0001E0BC92|nr:WD40 repeat domain-containing protein [Ahrensia sp. R2A130]EFL88755.1 WD repeat-containing protein [Ahrensia sp. R2A130]